MLKKDKEQFDMLEHVAKGVHIYGADRHNGRVVARPLDRFDEADDRRRRTAPRKPPKRGEDLR